MYIYIYYLYIYENKGVRPKPRFRGSTLQDLTHFPAPGTPMPEGENLRPLVLSAGKSLILTQLGASARFIALRVLTLS